MEAKYTAKTNLELDDFRRYAKTMGGQPRGLLLTVIVLLWILYSGVTNLRSGRFAMGGLMVAVVVICPLIYLYTSRRQSVKYFEKTPAHSRDFSRELAGQLYFFIIYMVNPH